MAINKLNGINPYEASIYGGLGAKPTAAPELTGQITSPSVNPGQTGFQLGGSQTSGVDSVFKQSIEGFGQKVNPFGKETPAFTAGKENYQNGLSLFGQGALGEEAIHTKDGRLGKELNLIA